MMHRRRIRHSIPVEDTQLPDWLASQLDEGAAEDSTAVKTTGKDGTYRTLLSVLVIVFTTCGIVTIGFAVALAEAAKKRKATQVHYSTAEPGRMDNKR